MKKSFQNYIFPFIKRFLIVLTIFSVFVFISAISYVNAVSEDISNSVFRLHVIANSDSEEDQELKYKVRDSVLQYMNKISSNCSSKEEVISLAEQHKDEFYEVALQTIKECRL